MPGAISSMTGFARADGAEHGYSWTIELKSVNSRGLEQRYRIPAGHDDLEPRLRASLQKALKRGAVHINLQLKTDGGEARLKVNETALNDAVAAMKTVHAVVDCAAPRAESVLALRGVLETAGEELDDATRLALHDRIAAAFDDGLARLVKARKSEGDAMADAITRHIAEIESLCAEATTIAETTPALIRDRLNTQLSELLKDQSIPADRLAQEASILAVKADVREELDRLRAHIDAARVLMDCGGAVGREFDFLTQEFNRETNTLCSKAQDMSLKQVGLSLKKVVDQLREQVQNIE